jgi:serine/threonine protein kinase
MAAPFTGAGWICTACAAARTQHHVLQPRAIAGYEILRTAARGGMGQVYEARHRATGAHVALKTLLAEALADETLVARFLKEQRRAVTLVHPNLIRTFDVGRDDAGGDLYMATEWLTGGDASDVGSPQLSLELALTLGADLFRAVAYLQGEGLVHRDIKPANLLLAPPGTAPIAGKLADFGITRDLAETANRITRDNEMAGTPLYSAPEQLLDFKWVGHTADIYSAAATIYFLLTGSTPLLVETQMAATVAVYTATLRDERVSIAQRRPDLPRELAEWIDSAVARDQGARAKMEPGRIAAWLKELSAENF